MVANKNNMRDAERQGEHYKGEQICYSFRLLTQCHSSVTIGQVSSAAIRWSQLKEEKVNVVNDGKL